MSVTEKQDTLQEKVSESDIDVEVSSFTETQREVVESHKIFEDLSVAQAALRRLAFTFELGDFSAPLSNLQHRHEHDKHDLREFGVTEELISTHLVTHHCDHAALWEMVARKEALIESDTPVFTGKPDNDPQTWNQIETVRNQAPVPEFIQSTIRNA